MKKLLGVYLQGLIMNYENKHVLKINLLWRNC